MRIAIAGLMHESNTFVAAPTTRDQFCVQASEAVLAHWKDSHHEVAGFIEGVTAAGGEVVPLLTAGATPGGPVDDEVLGWWVDEFAGLLTAAGELDGLLLALHGAMVIHSFPDGDGEVARRVRTIVGADFPLVITHDFHANLSEQVVNNCNALVVYKTNPHIDQRQRGVQAAEILTKMIRGEVHPTQALAKPPMIWNILHQNTSREPLHSILAEARQLEQQAGILAVSVVGGYQYADVHEVGPSVVVVTDNDVELAQREAARLAQKLWEARDQLVIDLPDAAEAVRSAMGPSLNPEPQSLNPVVLVEMGDNIGGGSPGDSTIILSELIRQNADGWCIVIADPHSVQQCVAAGVGEMLRLTVGGKTDARHGASIEVTGRVIVLHDGKYEETEPRHGGGRYLDQGQTAVVEISNPNSPDPEVGQISNRLVLTTKRHTPFSLHQLISLGLDPRAAKIIVVKAAIAYRAAYEPIAGRIIEVDTPGVTAVNPLRFEYRHARRPLWPLD